MPFRRHVEADEQKTYWLSENDGPWLIFCASFGGEHGLRQASDLVLELRRDHKLKAMVYKMKFDYAETVSGVGWEKYVNAMGAEDKRVRQMEYANTRDTEDIAVVVGDFPAIDDRRAEQILDRIKHLKPAALTVDEVHPTSQRLGTLREIQRRVSGDAEMKEKGPMRQAFMIQNPLLPAEYFNQQTIDTTILSLNRGIKYSLLNCPKPYSVRVATFRGESTFQLSEIARQKQEESRLIKTGHAIGKSRLAEAGEKATRLTAELRKLGVEAYEFHDRYESYVCVGGFDWVIRKNDAGREIWNDDVVKVIQDYRARSKSSLASAPRLDPRPFPASAAPASPSTCSRSPFKSPSLRPAVNSLLKNDPLRARRASE